MNTKIIFPINQDNVSNELALEVMNNGIQELIDSNAIKGPIDDVLVNYEFKEDTGYAIAELKEGSLLDASKLNEIGAGLYENPMDNGLEAADSYEQLKNFSAATIQERMRLAKRNPKLRLRYMIMDYKRYWQQKQSTLSKDKESVDQLKRMFLTDMTGIMTEVLPYIEEGKQLNTLIGVSQVAPKMTSVARELSLIYKRALKANASSGQIPKSIFSKLKELYNQFMTELLLVVFPGIKEVLGKTKEGEEGAVESVTKATSKTYSYTEDGRIKLFE